MANVQGVAKVESYTRPLLFEVFSAVARNFKANVLRVLIHQLLLANIKVQKV